jgi:AcrR family transcriptional regulator
MTDGRLRADAARNREAIVATARALFAEHGLDAPLDEIARRAGVGNATVYRRFASRADLITAVYAGELAEQADAVENALADPDPWTGFSDCLSALAGAQAGDRGLADLLTVPITRCSELEHLRCRALDDLARLARRAQDAGQLRADFGPEDLLVVLQANAGLVERCPEAPADTSRRLVHLLLDGLRAGPDPPEPDRRIERRP